jgi:hypothetical protein
MQSSSHHLIPFLPLFYNCQFQRLDSIQLLHSQIYVLVGWCLKTWLTLLKWTILYNHFAQTMQKHRLSIAEKACLQCCCIAMNGVFWLHYSDFQVSCHNILQSCKIRWYKSRNDSITKLPYPDPWPVRVKGKFWLVSGGYRVLISAGTLVIPRVFMILPSSNIWRKGNTSDHEPQTSLKLIIH